MGKIEYIIQSRIRDYENDLLQVYKRDSKEYPSQQERVRQDKVIIQELNRILDGNLEVLSYEL